MILCADIGATKTLLGLARLDASGHAKVVASQRYVAAQMASFDAMLDSFLKDQAQHLSQPLRAAYISSVIEVQAPKAESSSS